LVIVDIQSIARNADTHKYIDNLVFKLYPCFDTCKTLYSVGTICTVNKQ